MFECNMDYGSSICLKNISPLTNPGTLHKINFMKKYVDAWYSIVLNAGYKGVLFIDCMCNCGAYSLKDEIINGTSQEVMYSFLQDQKNSKKEFAIAVNDLLEDRIYCQKCIWERNEKKFGKKKNVKFASRNEDVSVFLRGYALKLLETASKKNYHVLLFYDPYDAKIDWEGMKPFIKASNVDVILTHFTSDTVRGLKEAKKKEKIEKYESTYDMKYGNIVSEINNPDVSSMTFLRNRILEKVKEIKNNKFVAYGPIFNSNNVVIYDIVSISKTKKSRDLLKSNLYTQYKELPADEIQTSLFAIDEDEDELNYDKLTEAGVTDKYYFYNPEQFARVIYSKFKKRKVLNSEYNDYLFNHDYIPTNANKQIDNILKNQYLVEIKNKNVQKGILEKYYDFRKKGEFSE